MSDFGWLAAITWWLICIGQIYLAPIRDHLKRIADELEKRTETND